MQSIKNWCSVQFSKSSRLKQQKLETKVFNYVPGISLFLNFILFSPFLLISIIFIIGPYMIDDYIQTTCIIDKSVSLKDQEKQIFYQLLTLNYTLNERQLKGVQERCSFPTEIERDRCLPSIEKEFQCFVDYSWNRRSHELENEIYTPEEFSQRNFSNSKTILILVVILFGSLILIYSFYKIFNLVMEKFILEKITEKDLGIGQIDEKEFSFKYTPELEFKGKDLNRLKHVNEYLAKTACEKEETIEWVTKARPFKLIRSSTWIIGIYIFIGIAPIIFLLMYFAIYSGFKFPWKVWGLVVIEISIAYIIFLYLMAIYFYIFVVTKVYYYITTTRSICLVNGMLITWVFQFPHSDIEKVDSTGEKEGTIDVYSKQFQSHIRLFSYVEDVMIVKILLTQKMDYQSGNDLKMFEENLGDSLNEENIVVKDEIVDKKPLETFENVEEKMVDISIDENTDQERLLK